MSEWIERRERNRSKQYLKYKKKQMTNKELRKENNKQITGQTENRSRAIQTGKFVSEALKYYIAGDEERFNTYSDRLKILVKTIYNNSIEGNNSTIQEMLNRLEGKVRDEVIIENRISDHIPDQKKTTEITKKYKITEQLKENEEKTIQ